MVKKGRQALSLALALLMIGGQTISAAPLVGDDLPDSITQESSVDAPTSEPSVSETLGEEALEVMAKETTGATEEKATESTSVSEETEQVLTESIAASSVDVQNSNTNANSNEIVVDSGFCGKDDGENLSWKITGTKETGYTLTISGTGEMRGYGYVPNPAPWMAYQPSTLILEEGITSIGEFAFKNCSFFTGNLVLPNSLVTIGDAAFWECSGFSGSLTVPGNVTSIGESAFSECTGFDGNLIISEGITEIGITAFSGCSGFSGKLELPQSVKTIDIEAFANCGFSELDLANVTEIGPGAFYHCTQLTGSLILPEKLAKIGGGAFENCAGLKTIQFLNSECSIYDSAATIDSGITILGYTGSTALDYAKKYHRLYVDLSVTGDEEYAMYRMDGNLYICSSTWEPTLEKLVNGDAVTQLHVEEGVQTLDNPLLLNGMQNLKYVSIPASVTSIKPGCFVNCPSLTAIEVGTQNENFESVDGVLYWKDSTGALGLFCYPMAKLDTEYRMDTLPQGIQVPYDAFSGAKDLKKIVFSSGTTMSLNGEGSSRIPNSVEGLVYNVNAATDYAVTKVSAEGIELKDFSGGETLGMKPGSSSKIYTTINVETNNTLVLGLRNTNIDYDPMIQSNLQYLTINVEPGGKIENNWVFDIKVVCSDGRKNIVASGQTFTAPTGLVKQKIVQGEGTPEISLPDDDLAEAVLTEADYAALQAGNDIIITMTVNKVEEADFSQEVLRKIQELISTVNGKLEPGFYLTLEIEKQIGDTGEKIPVSDIKGSVYVSFEIPEATRGKAWSNSMYYFDADSMCSLFEKPDDVDENTFATSIYNFNYYFALMSHKHEYGEWKETKAPTCTEAGEMERVCVCHNVERAEIEPTGHKAGEWTITKQPSCTETGLKVQKCSVCDTVMNSEIIQKTEHSSKNWTTMREATCTERGIEIQECDNCGAIFNSRLVDKIDHKAGAWVILSQASCTENGVRERRCERCQMLMESEVLPVLGHNWSEWKLETVPTTTSTGLQIRTCKKCGQVDRVTITKLPITDPVEAFVCRLYEQVLERQPETKGLKDWTSCLHDQSGTGAQAASGFIFSTEYERKNKSDDEFVEMLYRTMMNRKSDIAGKQSWLNLLANGVTRQYVFAGFVYSQEFQNVCRSYGITRGEYKSDAIVDQNADVTAFVSRMYTVVLGRQFDKDGLSDWTERLLHHEIGGGELSKGFFGSQEFGNKALSNRDFVIVCYRTYLNREPDSQGLNNWTNILNREANREAILDGFIGSQEFSRICTQYGIDR